ncbi:MAG: EamA family transporter [Caldilineales bacterium]|nr:EamA family transporter [Caldilineales bacterium]
MEDVIAANTQNESASSEARGYVYVVLAASLWATLGIMFTALYRLDVQPLTIAILRAALSGILLFVGLIIFRPHALKLSAQGWLTAILYGVVGIALFFVAYVNAVVAAGVSVAAVLLYTAPAWVALIAWRFLGESLTRTHALALALSLAGVALIAQVYRPEALSLNAWGLFWGLLAGVTYALYSIFNKVGVRHANPWALQCFGMLSAALALIWLQPLALTLSPFRSLPISLWLLALAVGPTIGASVSYAMSVQRLPVSVTSVVATLEPVLAVVLAAVILHERLASAQLLGGAMIVGAALLLRPR